MNKCILCCFLWICPVFGSNVKILVPNSLANENTFECGRDLTLSCKFKKKTFALAWKNALETVHISQCLRNGTECDINPKYIDQYNISYDGTNHIFNLTIINLTMKDDGRKLVCSDGTSTDSKLISVKDYEPLILENTTTGTIQAISGCITNVTKVSFKWIKIYAHNKREKEITPKIQNASVTSCSKDSDCGNDQQIQYSEVISAKASNNGNYFLKIVADYGNKQKESYYTVERYLIEDRDEEGSNTVIVVVVVLVVFALIFAAAVLLYLHCKKRLIHICIWRKFITYDKGNSDGRRFSQTKNETYKQSQREFCQKNKEQSEELNSNNEDTQREEGDTQTLGGYDGTEDLTKSASDLNLDLPKHNEEEVNSEANGMPVNEPSVNDISLDQAVAGIEEEKILSFEKHTINDLDPDGDELGNEEKQKYLLAKHHGLDDDMLENEEGKHLLSKEQTIIDLDPDGGELGNDEKQKYLLAKHHGLDGDMLENEEVEKLLSKEKNIIDPNEDSDESEEYHNTFWNMILSTFISPKTIDG